MLFIPVKGVDPLHFLIGQAEMVQLIIFPDLIGVALMVEEGIGYMIGIDKHANTSGSGNLCFVPLALDYRIHFDLVWKKYQTFSRPAELFLSKAKDHFRAVL